MQWADEKNRRDYFFCQLARLNFEEGKSNTDGWVVVPEAARKTGYSEDEIQDFLERLVEDGWIEVKGATHKIPSRVRLTLAGRARAQVICKTHH
jgi:DNA-binding MarR family transcriptional regulator